MKKLLMLSVLLALFAGKASYAQNPYPLDIETGDLTFDEGASFDDYDPGLVNHVLNPAYGYREEGTWPAGWYIEGGDIFTLPPGVDRTRLYVQFVATGIDSSDSFDGSSDEIVGNGVVDVYLGATFNWSLYSSVIFEWTEEYSDGTWEDIAEQWDL